MKVFTDATNRQWEIALTIGSAKRVKSLLGIDLLQPESGDPPLLTRLGTDEMLLCDIIYCLVKPQADAAGIRDEEFGELLGGEVILAAQTALYEELIDFFQQRGRTDRSRAVAAQKQMIELAIQNADQQIAQLDLSAELNKTSGSSSTN